MTASYLDREVSPLLDGVSGRPGDRALIDAVAVFRVDAGWVAYDAARQQVASQQYTTALRLAQSSGYRLVIARVLAAMSHQAIYLGQIRQAIDYAEAARAATAWTLTKAATGATLPAPTATWASTARQSGTPRNQSACAGSPTAAPGPSATRFTQLRISAWAR